MTSWKVFKGSGEPHDGYRRFLSKNPPPPWRKHAGADEPSGTLRVDPQLAERFASAKFIVGEKEIDVVNAAIYLRRPLLVTGKPGTGKTTLAHAIAHELKLGHVLTWPITSRSTLNDALYRYDAIGRLQEANLPENQKNPEKRPDIGKYIRLGPVGTALLPVKFPRVLLVDEIDKSDVDLPNDLLHVFEDGRYEIPELTRLPADQGPVQVFPQDGDQRVAIPQGRVQCHAFPIVILTSNGEREFPPPFLRRCVRLDIPEHDEVKLGNILQSYFNQADATEGKLRDDLIKKFLARRTKGDLATDQLLNALFLTRQGFDLEHGKDKLIETIFQYLGSGITS